MELARGWGTLLVTAAVLMFHLRMLQKLRRKVAKIFRRQPHTGYRYRRDDTVINDFAEFSGMPITEVAAMISKCRSSSATEWRSLDGSFSERAAKFYENSHEFIFDTLSANPSREAVISKLNRFNPKIMASIAAHPGNTFFEFGAGIGVFCDVIASMGKSVTYLELPGLPFNFAKWRFQRYGLKVNMIEAAPDRIGIPGRYDIIYTDAVIEHLPTDMQIEATKAMAGAVAGGGLLVFLADLSGPTALDPMHHDVDIRRLHDILTSNGLFCEDGRSTFCSIWRRR